MTAMTIPPPEISSAELRAFVLCQVERLEQAVAPIRQARHDPVVEDEDPVRRRVALETRVATLEDRFALGGR